MSSFLSDHFGAETALFHALSCCTSVHFLLVIFHNESMRESYDKQGGPIEPPQAKAAAFAFGNCCRDESNKDGEDEHFHDS
jgi:hypothetical protein